VAAGAHNGKPRTRLSRVAGAVATQVDRAMGRPWRRAPTAVGPCRLSQGRAVQEERWRTSTGTTWRRTLGADEGVLMVAAAMGRSRASMRWCEAAGLRALGHGHCQAGVGGG